MLYPNGRYAPEPPFYIAELMANGVPKFSAVPQPHPSMFNANRELQRLRAKEPFKDFVIVGTMLRVPYDRNRLITVGEVYDRFIKNKPLPV